MSLINLAKIINTKNKSIKEFQLERWKRGFGCVRCGSVKVWKHQRLKNGLEKYQCQDCKHVFSDQSSTVLKWNKLKIREVAIINYFSGSKLSIREIAKEAAVNKNSAEQLRRKIRKTNGQLYKSLSPPLLSGVIEMDETKMAKEWFWGAIERKTGKGIVEYVYNRNENTLSRKIWKYINENSVLITDEWGGYANINNRFYSHYTVNHSKEFVNSKYRKIHTNNIENLWKQLKRKINHFCNGVKLEHISDYINEYFYTKNHDQSKKPLFFPLYCQKF